MVTLVGQLAKRQSVVNPENTFSSSVKDLLAVNLKKLKQKQIVSLTKFVKGDNGQNLFSL
jgi:molecular chaperone DnaK (HSP70)